MLNIRNAHSICKKKILKFKGISAMVVCFRATWSRSRIPYCITLGFSNIPCDREGAFALANQSWNLTKEVEDARRNFMIIGYERASIDYLLLSLCSAMALYYTCGARCDENKTNRKKKKLSCFLRSTRHVQLRLTRNLANQQPDLSGSDSYRNSNVIR